MVLMARCVSAAVERITMRGMSKGGAGRRCFGICLRYDKGGAGSS